MKGRLSLWVVLGVVGAVMVAWGCQSQGSKPAVVKAAPATTAADPIVDDLLKQVSKAPVKVATKPKPVTVAKVDPPKVEPPKTDPVKEPVKVEPPKTEPVKEPVKPATGSGLDQLYAEMDRIEKGQSAGVDPQTADKAEALYAAGRKLYDDVRYEEALAKFEDALRVNPRHQAAADYAEKTRSILNMGLSAARRALDELDKEQTVKLQEALNEISNVIEAGKRARAESRAAKVGDDNLSRDKVLSRQLAAAEKAVELYDRALEIIRWMPHQLDLSTARRQIDVARADSLDRAKELRGELAAYQRERAQQEALASKAREGESFKQMVNAMLDRARFDYKNGKYEEAEGICDQVLRLDPHNGSALSLRADSREEKHKARERENYLSSRIERRGVMARIEDSSIPYSRTLVYPENWNQVMRRDEATGTSDVEPEWMSSIRRKLEKKVTFEFTQQSLTEAIDFLQSVGDVNIILDPEVKKAGTPQITLRMSQATLALALKWILDMAGLEHELRDNAVYIMPKGGASTEVKMVIYDVQDLTLVIQDYPGPEMDLSLNQAGAQQLPVAPPPANNATATTQSIKDMITQRVRPESWKLPGISIEERAGKLVVVQKPEVHRMISSLLADLRQTQKIMVVVEGRLLRIREGLLEDIGINWGTMSLGTPQVPTNTVGMTNTRGALTTIGSVINNNLQVSPDRTPLGTWYNTQSGTGVTPGLSAELHFLEALQLRAVAHALRIKDNGAELQAPKLMVHNGQRAHMWVGTQQSYVSGASATGSTVDPTVNQLRTGVVFDVRPIVSADRRYITMELRPTFTTLVSMATNNSTTTSTGTTGTTGTTTTNVTTQLPTVEQIMVRTSATIPDGGIILIGGRMRDVQFSAEAGIPGAMNIPVIGRLFRWDRKDNERENLAIMVTARSLLFDEEERKNF